MHLKGNGLKRLTKFRTNKKFVYLISPNKIKNKSFYSQLKQIFKLNKVAFFQLRLKKENKKNKLIIGRRIQRLCKKYKVKYIINDDPLLAKKINSDGCHLGKNDTNIVLAKKILKKHLIGITCHNSKKLIKKAVKNQASYIALGAFFSTKTKKIKYKASTKILNWAKKTTNIPIVAVGGINFENYKRLLLNKANFLAISSYIWKNKKFKPIEAIKKLK